jgi:hypothetical protein
VLQNSKNLGYFLAALRVSPFTVFIAVCQTPIALTLHHYLFAHSRQWPFLFST